MNNQVRAQGQVLGIDHVAIAVEDLEASVALFTQHLGFEVVSRRLTQGSRTSMVSAVLKCGATVLVLVQGMEDDCHVTEFVRRRGPGVQHLALAVTDLKTVVKRVGEAGLGTATHVIEGDGLAQVFLARDRASAVRLELIERRGGDFTDETINQLFLEFESKELY